MRMPRSNRFLLNPSEKKSLARMARNSSRVNVVDKGDISDCDSSASLEEISADDFRHDVRGSRSRVWDDGMMGYSVASNFGPTLYSFAWAQAVQNKPLGLEINPLKDAEGETGKDGTLYSVIGDISEESIGEMEKEKGELEEGEIDLDSEPVLEEVISYVSDNAEDQSMLLESETKETDDMEEADMEDFDKRVAEILEELDTITPEEAEASLESVCSRLLKSFAGLKTMFTESYVPILDALVQQAFTGIQTLHSVFCSGNLMKTKQNMDLLLRLLIHIKNQYSALLTLEQVTEIDSMAQLLVSNDVSKEIVAHEGNSIYNSDSTTGQPDRPTTSSNAFSEKPNFNLKETDLSGRHGGGNYFANYELPIAKSRVEFSPLLDLHADYDEGSLPSPTRENGPPLLTHKPIDFSTSLSYPIDLKKEEGDEETLHSYMNDALKAVSSYQQKYQRTSINLSNQLPSPTPSEEFSYENEKQDEVSSAFVFGADKSVKGVDSLTLMGFGNTFTSSDALTGPPFTSNKLGGQLNSMKKQIVKTKSRDPRLRFINDNVAAFSDSSVFGNGITEGKKNCNKHRISDTVIQDDQDFKRQRHTSNVPTDMPVSVSNVVSETFNKPPLTVSVEIGMGKSVSAASTSDTRVDANDNSISAHLKNEKSTTISSAPSVTLPSLLKEMDISPAMLMELFKIKQQGLTEESQQKSGTSTCVTTEIKCASGYPGSASSVNGIKLKPEEVEQNPTSKPRISAQYPSSNLQNDMGRLRMKPRDPRRYFHDNTVTKAETSVSVSEQNKMDSVSNTFQTDMDRLIDKELGEQAQAPCSSRQFLKTNIKNIADSMFTKNLKNIGDNNISATKLAAVSPILGPLDMLQPISNMTNKPVGRFTEFNESKVVNGISQTGTRDASQQANPWGDVDHLLNGYDDQQRAAIQKERARRIAEQNKMFAARKLCLVLDLDHTLLNSAKFGEVEQVHEEILRKKEEQDREQPQRHLFRFQHMAMWTKLRPGVWNFLEKASKIYELHLYTMGNKFYATEMAKVLDPTGILFAGRVISRGDDGDLFDGDDRVPKSKDLDGVLGMESAVVIIDDSVRVWPHNRHNLILVERYTYFPCSRRQFGLLGPSLLEIDHDERQEDGTLASCLAVIEKIHEIFFSHNCLNDVDVRHILATEQRKILAGCKIVFSRIFPVGEANPNFHPLWQTAEQFGAICTNQIDEQVTHVVANSLGTDKVNWALSTGRFVVHPGWVEASALLYRRANENDFAVKLYQAPTLNNTNNNNNNNNNNH